MEGESCSLSLMFPLLLMLLLLLGLVPVEKGERRGDEVGIVWNRCWLGGDGKPLGNTADVEVG